MGSFVIFCADYKLREMPKLRNVVRAKINALKVSFNRYFSCHAISWEKNLSKRNLIKHLSLVSKHLILAIPQNHICLGLCYVQNKACD